MELNPRLSKDGRVEPTASGWRLSIPAGPQNRYRLAQLDDQRGRRREDYAWRPPLALRLRARASSSAAPGTWGFGLWNDPFGFSCGPGDSFLRLPALPNAEWFFHSSGRSHLSLREDKPANGFVAQVFRSPRFHPRVIQSGITLPFSARSARKLLSRVVEEESVQLYSISQAARDEPAIDPTRWHTYQLEWTANRTRFQVDEKLLLDTPLSPHAPLGLVIWIDNQYAAFHPGGQLRWGLEANPEGAWLDIEQLEAESESS